MITVIEIDCSLSPSLHRTRQYVRKLTQCRLLGYLLPTRVWRTLSSSHHRSCSWASSGRNRHNPTSFRMRPQNKRENTIRYDQSQRSARDHLCPTASLKNLSVGTGSTGISGIPTNRKINVGPDDRNDIWRQGLWK